MKINSLNFTRPRTLTLDDGQQDDYDEEEESDVEKDAVNFVLVAVRRFDLIADAATGSDALVQVEDEALQRKE